MSQCSYVNVKHTGTAELAQSVQPSARLRPLLALAAPCPGPRRGWLLGRAALPRLRGRDGPTLEGLWSCFAPEDYRAVWNQSFMSQLLDMVGWWGFFSSRAFLRPSKSPRDGRVSGGSRGWGLPAV